MSAGLIENVSLSVAVTGANGFIGQALSEMLSGRGYSVRRLVRAPGIRAAVSVGDIGPGTSWLPALENIRAVIHAAARVHVTAGKSADSLAEFRLVNVAGARRLAEQAVEAGVKRLVFISSVKAINASVSSFDAPPRSDPYGRSKWEAEQALREVAAGTGLEVVILRSPLVYGPGVKANFLRLLDLVYKGWPLPLGGMDNRRSFIALENLLDAIELCIRHPDAAGKTCPVSDGEDMSTTELISRICAGMGKPARLFPVPAALAEWILTVSGHKDLYDRLWGSLMVDSGRIRRELGWTPPVSVTEGLKKTVDWYLHERH